MTEITRKDVEQIIRQAWEKRERPDLSGKDLSEIDLHKIDLLGANLSGANLCGADLSNSRLSLTNLTETDLSGANLSWAELLLAKVDLTTKLDHKWRLAWEIVNHGADGRTLRRVDLSKTNLVATDLRRADLRGANLSEANLTRTQLQDANLIQTNLRETELSQTDLSGTRIDNRTQLDEKWCLVWEIVNQGADGQTLHGKDLSNANLVGARLALTDLYKAILQGANLKRADLSKADLRKVNLRNANLNGAYLTGSDLGEADLSRATLIGADLTGSDLRDVTFTGATLCNTKFRSARGNKVVDYILSFPATASNLSGANFSKAILGATYFESIDLSGTKGLDTVVHRGPSILDIDTIYRSKGKIPEVFLQGAGVPEIFITYMPSLTGKPIEYYSCFISYSHKDLAFAQRLHADLQQKGVRCWFAPEDMKIGDRIRSVIDQSIRLHDKLLLILSENSFNSFWVESEVEKAFEEEHKRNQTVLFAVQLDEAVMETDKAWAAEIRRTRHIGDFSRWKDHDAYQGAFERLLRDLKAEGQEQGS